MRKKMLVSCLVLMILFVNISNVLGASIFTIRDPRNDVTLFSNTTGSVVDQGNFHNEIDIIKCELVDEMIVVTLEDAPIIDLHEYFITIRWETVPFLHNYTFGYFGSGWNNIVTNYWNSTGHGIAYNTVLGAITVSGRTIIYPISNYTMLTDPSTPDMCRVETKVYTDNPHEYYNDTLRELNITPGLPGYTFEIITFTMITISVLYVIRKKQTQNFDTY
ncbi:MAG: hypothetical protein ACTSSK_04310 [Candidatus Heimdallarchaeota archaeon]